MTVQPSQSSRRIAGVLLLVPALLALLWSYVLPSLSTVVQSTRRGDLIREGESVGFDNYQAAADDGFGHGVGTAVLLALVPLLAALVAAPLLALAADQAGRPARILTRVLLALPLALYAPAAVTAGWLTVRVRDGWRDFGSTAAIVEVYTWISFGLVVAIAATAFLAALRGRRPGRGPGLALLSVGGVLALGVVATGLQAFTVPSVFGAKSPPPVPYAVLTTFRNLEVGPGAATSTLLGLVLGVLGLAAVGLLLATRTRIEVEGAPAADRSNPAAAVAAIAGGVVLLGIVVYALFPWLRHLANVEGPDSIGRVVVNTWVPPLLTTVFGVAMAAAGGYAIGALRPLGRHSELILLLFAPWLFVGTGPLAIAGYLRADDFGQINTLLGLVPPTWLSVPALVIFTLFFRSRRSTVVGALPLVALAMLLVWLRAAQDLLWPYLVAPAPEQHTGPQAVVNLTAVSNAEGDGVGMGLALPIPLLLFFVVAFVALQIGYLDRLVVRTGREDETPAPAPPFG